MKEVRKNEEGKKLESNRETIEKVNEDENGREKEKRDEASYNIQ